MSALPIGQDREQALVRYRASQRTLARRSAFCGHHKSLHETCLACWDRGLAIDADGRPVEPLLVELIDAEITTPTAEPEQEVSAGSPAPSTAASVAADEGNAPGVTLTCALCGAVAHSERGAKQHATRAHATINRGVTTREARDAAFEACFPAGSLAPRSLTCQQCGYQARTERAARTHASRAHVDTDAIRRGETWPARAVEMAFEGCFPRIASSPQPDGPDLNEVLHGLGYRTETFLGNGDKRIIRGDEVVFHGDARYVWLWLRATRQHISDVEPEEHEQSALVERMQRYPIPYTPADVPSAPIVGTDSIRGVGVSGEKLPMVGEPAGPQCAPLAGSPAPEPGLVEASPASAGPGGTGTFVEVLAMAGPPGLAQLFSDGASLADQAEDPYVVEVVPPAPALLLRGSAMGLGFLCPQSTRSGLRLDLDEEAARLGSAVHEVVAEVLRGQVPDVETERAQAAADHWQLDDAEEVERLAGAAVRQLADLMQLLPELATAEVEVGGRVQVPGTEQWITGTADLRTRRGTRGFVIDLKSGFREHAHYHQLMTYATQMLAADPTIDSVQAAPLHVRAGRLGRAIVVTRATAQTWLERVRREVVESEQYRAGPHCTLCPRRFDCAPKRAWTQTITEEALGDGLSVDSLESLAADELIALRGSGVVLRRIGEERVEAVRQYVEQHGDIEGSVSSVVRRVEERREIVPERAIHVLQRVVGRDALLAAMRVRNKELEQAVREAAPRGQKGERVKAMWGELESAGAVERSKFSKVMEVGR